MFKTSVKGFKKSDVNNYIIQMHREFAEEKEAHEEELSRIRAEHQKAVDSLGEKDALIDELNKRIGEAEALADENNRLSAENEMLADKVSALTAELSRVSIKAEIAEESLTEITAELNAATDTVSRPEAVREHKQKNEVAGHFNIPDAATTVSNNKKGRNSILSKLKKVFN